MADHQISEADLRPRGPPSGRAHLARGQGCNRCRDSSGAGVRAFGGLHAVVDGEALPSTERREDAAALGAFFNASMNSSGKTRFDEPAYALSQRPSARAATT